jgi:DNA-binding transcriptional regulator YhcF (GntR family)
MTCRKGNAVNYHPRTKFSQILRKRGYVYIDRGQSIFISKRCTKVKERRSRNLVSISGEISPEKMNLLLTKLRLHTLTKGEAREFLPIFENEIKEAKYGDKREYKKVVIRLTEILKMYLIDAIDLNGRNFDALNELDTVKMSSKVI